MENFYASQVRRVFLNRKNKTETQTRCRAQAAQYDAFRESFLAARGPLIASLPLTVRTSFCAWSRAQRPLDAQSERAEAVWIDVGGGTGRNLEVALRRPCVPLSHADAMRRSSFRQTC